MRTSFNNNSVTKRVWVNELAIDWFLRAEETNHMQDKLNTIPPVYNKETVTHRRLFALFLSS